MSIIIAIGHMPGQGVHRSATEPFAKAMERTFEGRPGFLTWRVGASYGPVMSQWRLSAPRFVHHHRHRSYNGVWSAQIGPRAFRKGHGACLSRQAWICDLEAWSQLWACEEPVAGVGAQICPSSSPSDVCRGLECIDRSQSLPQAMDLSLGRLTVLEHTIRSSVQ